MKKRTLIKIILRLQCCRWDQEKPDLEVSAHGLSEGATLKTGWFSFFMDKMPDRSEIRSLPLVSEILGFFSVQISFFSSDFTCQQKI